MGQTRGGAGGGRKGDKTWEYTKPVLHRSSLLPIPLRRRFGAMETRISRDKARLSVAGNPIRSSGGSASKSEQRPPLQKRTNPDRALHTSSLLKSALFFLSSIITVVVCNLAVSVYFFCLSILPFSLMNYRVSMFDLQYAVLWSVSYDNDCSEILFQQTEGKGREVLMKKHRFPGLRSINCVYFDRESPVFHSFTMDLHFYVNSAESNK